MGTQIDTWDGFTNDSKLVQGKYPIVPKIDIEIFDSSHNESFSYCAGGYIGNILTQLLIKKNHEIVVIDRFLFVDTLKEYSNVLKIKADLRTIPTEDLQGAMKGVDAVIDLAALSNDPSGELNPINTISINHLGRFRVTSIAKSAGVKKYLLP